MTPVEQAKMPRSATRFGYLYESLIAVDGRWIDLVIGASIIFAGLMFTGYAVFDELSVYLILAVVVVFNPLRGVVSDALPETRIQSWHRYVFVAFAAYLVGESIRGMFAIPDFRVIRFAAMFAALGFVGWLARPSSSRRDSRLGMARTITACNGIYSVFYIVVGLIDELVFGGWRFDLQGQVWVGSTAAFVPVLVAIPALLVVAMSGVAADRRLAIAVVAADMVAAFYYQSRLTWIAFLVLIISFALLKRYRWAAAVAICYMAFVAIFPWRSYHALVLSEFTRYIVNTVSGSPVANIQDNVHQFVDITFGSFAKWKVDRVDTVEVVNGKKIVVNRATSEGDLDRKLAILAAYRAVTGDGIARFLFGTGFYTHRFVMLPYIHSVAKEFKYEWPATYNSIVRTATFNGMLVDDGFIGIGLLLALFALTWFVAIGIVEKSDQRVGLSFCVSGILTIAGLSLIAASNFDMIILYLALMPSGAILAVLPSHE